MSLRYEGVRFSDGSVAVRRIADDPCERATSTFESIRELEEDIGSADVTWIADSLRGPEKALPDVDSLWHVNADRRIKLRVTGVIAGAAFSGESVIQYRYEESGSVHELGRSYFVSVFSPSRPDGPAETNWHQHVDGAAPDWFTKQRAPLAAIRSADEIDQNKLAAQACPFWEEPPLAPRRIEPAEPRRPAYAGDGHPAVRVPRYDRTEEVDES